MKSLKSLNLRYTRGSSLEQIAIIENSLKVWLNAGIHEPDSSFFGVTMIRLNIISWGVK